MEKNKFSPERVKKMLNHPSSAIEKKGQMRNYKHKKNPPTPITSKESSSKKPLGKAKVILQKASKSHLEQMKCSHNQNYPLFFLEKSKKIKNFKVKERLIALQNIRKLSHQMQQWIYSKMHQDVKVCQNEPIEFYQMIEKREERHFRIDRIIRYLSEP